MCYMRGRAGQIMGGGFSGTKGQLGVRTTKAVKRVGCSNLKQLIEDSKDKISIQHLLQVGNPTKPHIVKHWRQDWMYQNQDFYMKNSEHTVIN